MPALSDTLPDMPLLAHRFLEQATSGKLQVEWTSGDLKRLRVEVRRASRRSFNAIIGTGLIVAAAIIYGLDGHAPLMVMGAPLLSWICGALGIFLLLLNWPENSE